MSNDPLADRLSQFTPDGSGLDRDALLFAAGRASARPERRWKALAGILATLQVVTLAILLWPRDLPRADQPIKGPASPMAFERPELDVPRAPQAWPLSERDFDQDVVRPTDVPSAALAPAPPVLRAFGAPPSELLN